MSMLIEQSWESKESEVALSLVGNTNVQNRTDPAEPFRLALPVLETGEAPITSPTDVKLKTTWRFSMPRAMRDGTQSRRS